MWSNVKKIVFDALRYQPSGSRTDNNTTASGNATLISGQNAADGQSTVALYPARNAPQSSFSNRPLVWSAFEMVVFGVLMLKDCPSLEYVDVAKTRVSLGGLAGLRSVMPNVEFRED